MKVYADTNFFTNLWLELNHSDQAQGLHRELLKSSASLPVTRLLRMELTNALQRCVFETRNGTQGIRVSPQAALLTRLLFDEELEAGVVLQWRTIPEDTLEATFETLAYRHTATDGFRTYDIFHVASALVLGCDTFWTFDAKAKRLAKIEGLRTNS